MNELFLKSEPEFDTGNNEKYEVKVIKESTIYAKEVKGHLPGLYYLVF